MTSIPLSLEHLVRPSNLNKKAPTIILLHGYGSDEQDLFSFAPELPEKYLILSVRAPHTLQPFGNAWYEINPEGNAENFSNTKQGIASRKKMENFIEEVITHYPVDASKITLLGFSQGSILSYAIALSQPEKIKQVIALSGCVDESLMEPDYRKNDFSSLRFYVSHGSADQVIPVQWARKTKPFLDALHIENTYSEFPVGHGVSPQNFFEFKEWLANEK